MKQNVCVSLKLSSTVQILYDGEVNIEKDCFQYREKDSDVLTTMELFADGVRVERFSDPRTVMHLSGDLSFIRVYSSEGELEIPNVRLLSFVKNTNGMMFFYQVEELRCLCIEYKEK